MAKKALESPQILDRTLQLLDDRPKSLTYHQIEKDTGLTVAWLTYFSTNRGLNDFSLKRVVTLYEYLSHTKLVAP